MVGHDARCLPAGCVLAEAGPWEVATDTGPPHGCQLQSCLHRPAMHCYAPDPPHPNSNPPHPTCAAPPAAAARDFVQSCLNRDEKKRPTAEQLLQHPWLQVRVPCLAALDRVLCGAERVCCSAP